MTVRRSEWWEQEGRRENQEREQRALCKSEGGGGDVDVEDRNRDLVVVRESWRQSSGERKRGGRGGRVLPAVNFRICFFVLQR